MRKRQLKLAPTIATLGVLLMLFSAATLIVGGNASYPDDKEQRLGIVEDALAAIGTPERMFTVSTAGTDYTSIETALTAAGIVATAADRATVEVGPGTYAETCPVPVPQYVTAVARGGHEAVIMTCGAGVHGFVLASDSDVRGIQVEGVGTAGFAAFHWPAAVEHAHVTDARVVDFDIGWLSESVGEGNTVDASGIYSGTTTSGVKTGAGMLLRAHNFYVAPSATITNVFHADGAGALMFVQGAAVYSPNVTNCVHSDNGAVMRVAGSGCSGVVNGLRVGTDAEVLLVGGGVDATSGYDAVLETATSELYLGGTWLQKDKIDGVDVGLIVGCATTDTPGDQGQWCIGEFHVGDRRAGRETCLGGGDSYFTDTIAFLNDNLAVGTWSDETAASQSSSGSTFTAFPGKSAGECMYLGSPYAFPGLKVNITTALVVAAGEVDLEYWNGAWVPLRHMSTNANAPYEQYGDFLFERTGSEQIRFERDGTPGWAKTTLNGENQYWVRLCVVGGAIATAPVFEQFKFHTHRIEFNADGLMETFGLARPPVSIAFNMGSLYELDDAGPKDQTLSYGNDKIVLKVKKNKFEDNALDGTGGKFLIPEGLDTSTPLTITTMVMPLAVGGDIEMEFSYVTLEPEDPIDGSVVETPSADIQAAGTINVPQAWTWTVDISALVPGDTVAFALWRDAQVANNADDDLAGHTALTAISIDGYAWR
jgi:hypothetical protein